jgi:hypothetical protein
MKMGVRKWIPNVDFGRSDRYSLPRVTIPTGVPMESIRAKTDQKIERLEAQLEKLRAFRRSLDDPELSDLVSEQAPPRRTAVHRSTSPFEALRSPVATASTNGKRRNLALDAISKFFASRNNQPATLREIREGSGLAKGRVSNLVYVKRRMGNRQNSN